MIGDDPLPQEIGRHDQSVHSTCPSSLVSLGMLTTAEGVETVEQLSRVKEQGCAEVQGFHFGVPRRLAEIEILLGDNAISAA
jgi:EAL domain-containing protein (putative c-di-GMP-specific phosphodiesterase class I)